MKSSERNEQGKVNSGNGKMGKWENGEMGKWENGKCEKDKG